MSTKKAEQEQELLRKICQKYVEMQKLDESATYRLYNESYMVLMMERVSGKRHLTYPAISTILGTFRELIMEDWWKARTTTVTAAQKEPAPEHN